MDKEEQDSKLDLAPPPKTSTKNDENSAIAGMEAKKLQYAPPFEDEKLPNNVRNLFTFLIKDFKAEYGDNFVHDILGITAISKDGLLENQINDFMSFREERLGTLYDANFSRIYYGLNSFLAAGGGGYLRFFHDQLKYVVREMLDDSFIKELHQFLSDFFYQSICTQFKNKPSNEKKAVYNDHSLNQIVYHRIQAGISLKDTLRDIFFIRERVVAGQLQNLVNDYNEAIKVGDKDVSIYKEWLSFSQMYAHRIQEFPKLAYNMAVNQSKVSTIRKDTKEMYPNGDVEGVLYWSNSPRKVDPMISKYPYGGYDISSSKNIVAISGETVVLLDAFSGEMIHKLVGLSAHSICIDESADKVYCGGTNGEVSRWDVSTGAMEWTTSVCSGALVWTYLTQNLLLVGEGHARKAICWNQRNARNCAIVLDQESGDIVRKITLDGPAFDYAYITHGSVEIILAAQKGDVTGWDLHSGENLFTVKTGHNVVYSVSVHPTLPRFIFGGNLFHVHEYEILDDASGAEKVEERSEIVDTTSSGWLFGGNWAVSYDYTGERILTAEPQSQSVRIYSPSTGEMFEEMRGHQDCINKISLSRDGVHVLTADRGDGSILYKLPDTDWVVVEENSGCSNAIETEKIKWAMFGKDGDVFYTAAVGKLRAYDAHTLELLQSNEDTCTHYRVDGAISADGSYLAISTSRGGISFFDVGNLEDAFHEVIVLPNDDHSITSVTMSPDSTKLLVTDCANYNSKESVAIVLDISDVRTCKTPEVYNKVAGARVFSGAIHIDNDTAVYAGHGETTIFSISSKETLHTFRDACFFVRFMSCGHLLYSSDEDLIRYDWENEEEVMHYEAGSEVSAAILLKDEKEIFLGTKNGMIKVYDTEGNWEAKYAFFNHQAQGYSYLHASPDEKTILAPDASSQLYILKDTDI